VAVTVIVAEIGALPVFVAVKDGISPDPLEAKPIAVLVLVHVKVPPGGLLAKFVAGTEALLHIVKLAGNTDNGLGLTVIL